MCMLALHSFVLLKAALHGLDLEIGIHNLEVTSVQGLVGVKMFFSICECT